jgi:hypothetical protein
MPRATNGYQDGNRQTQCTILKEAMVKLECTTTGNEKIFFSFKYKLILIE